MRLGLCGPRGWTGTTGRAANDSNAVGLTDTRVVGLEPRDGVANGLGLPSGLRTPEWLDWNHVMVWLTGLDCRPAYTATPTGLDWEPRGGATDGLRLQGSINRELQCFIGNLSQSFVIDRLIE